MTTRGEMIINLTDALQAEREKNAQLTDDLDLSQDNWDKLEAQNAQLRAALDVETKSLEGKIHQLQYLIKEYDAVLELLLLHFENITEHECLGYECAECSPSTQANLIVKAWDSNALADSGGMEDKE